MTASADICTSIVPVAFLAYLAFGKYVEHRWPKMGEDE